MSTNFLQHLRSESAPLVLRRGKPGPEWPDEAIHSAAYAHGPEHYALSALAVRPSPN